MSAPRQLFTARLDLRCWCAADAPELRAALDASDAHLRPWIPFMRDEPRSMADTEERVQGFVEHFDAGRHFRYVIRERSTQTLVGETMLLTRGAPGTLEIGYWLHRDHCGHGYATEANAALLPVAFDVLGAARVAVVCDERNAASIAVAGHLGVALAEAREEFDHDGPVRLLDFQLSREDWIARRT